MHLINITLKFFAPEIFQLLVITKSESPYLFILTFYTM